MRIRPARGRISRPTLIWIVVAAFLISSGVGVYFAVRKGSRSAAPAGSPITLDAPPPSAGEGLKQSFDGRAQFADKDDPSRLAGETLYKRLDPLPRGRYALDEPQLWMFMKDGRTLHVRAAKGTVKFFQGTQKPESGRFEGGVVARIYAPGVATADSRPDPAKVAPEMLVYTESITFDLSVGEYSTENVVNLSNSDVEIQGEGMTIVFNEVRSSVAQIELGGIGFLHHRGGGGGSKPAGNETKVAAAPSTAPPTAPTAPAGTPSSPTNATPPAPSATPAPPKIDLYSVSIAGPIALTAGSQSPQSISADRLLAWARLVDGKLAPDAIAELRAKSKESAPAATTSPAPIAPPVAETVRGADAPAPAQKSVAATPGIRERLAKLRVNGPGGIVPLTPIHDDDALLTWGGRLLAVAIDQPPPELEKEQVAVRFVSESTEPVMLLDSRTGSTVLCNSLYYGATTAGAELLGKDKNPITLADPHGGHGELPTLTINLKTGIGQSRDGPGYLERRDPTKKTTSGEPSKQHIAWTDQLDFVLATGASGAGMQSIREAAFTGHVKGDSDDAKVEGDFLKAWLVESSKKDSIMERVVIEGNAVATSGGSQEASQERSQEPQSLRAGKFDLAFRLNSDKTESTPSALTATGGIHGERTEMVPDENDKSKRVARVSTLTSQSLEAALGRDAKGNTIVTDAVARGGASFVRSDGVKAEGDEIRTAVVDKTATITGEKAAVAARGATLAAPDLFLDGGREPALTFSDVFANQSPLHGGASRGVLADRFYGVIARGPGHLEHTDPKAAKLDQGQRAAIPVEQIGLTTITWTKGLRYDDASGVGDAIGGVVAVTHPDPFTQETVTGEHLAIRTAPAEPKPKGSPAKDAKPGEASPLEDMRLLSAEAIAGAPIDEKNPPKATAEQRLYVADDSAAGGRRLEKLTYIEGPRLVADEEHGVFRVPAAGRALVLDHSVARKEKAAPSDSPFASASSNGTTLLEWSGSMTMNRLTELADAGGGVRITHKPLNASEKPVVLNADTVQARFKLATRSNASGETSPAPAESKKDQLISATATGEVRITTEGGNKELSADSATYFAVDQIVEASATQQYSGVTWLDKTRGVPIIARKMRWNLRTDAVEIIEPMPTAAPLK